MDDESLLANQIIAQFMTASAPLEKYLQHGGALTDLQLESVSLTVSGLQTFLDI
jgi:hypothetical protein